MKITKKQRDILAQFKDPSGKIKDQDIEMTSEEVLEKLALSTSWTRHMMTEMVGLKLLKRRRVKGYNFYYYVYKLGELSPNDIEAIPPKKKTFNYVPCGLMMQVKNHVLPDEQKHRSTTHILPDSAKPEDCQVYIEQSKFNAAERKSPRVYVGTSEGIV